MGKFVPVTEKEQKEMLAKIGVSSIEDLFANIPEEVKIQELNLPDGCSELEVKKAMTDFAKQNRVFDSVFRGAGAYKHYIPSIVKSVTSKEAFLTAYTPYQAEISQGILQSIFEYQTMMCELTGMDVSNASVYDGATAAAEAIAMCKDRKKNKAIVSGAIHPEVMKTIETYCHGNGIALTVLPVSDGKTNLSALKDSMDAETACVYVQSPNYYGLLEDAEEIGKLAKEAKVKYILGVNPISLGILKTPDEYGVDIAVGEGQPLGLPLSFGGPYLGFMTATKDMMRKLPGRIVGQTVDVDDKRAFVLTLQAREQHIRREKASSNICSNEALCALTASVYLAAMGKTGLEQVALSCTSKAHYMAEELGKIGYERVHTGEFFHEFVTKTTKSAKEVLAMLEEHGILGGLALSEDTILWCCTEMNTKEEIDTVVSLLKGGADA